MSNKKSDNNGVNKAGLAAAGVAAVVGGIVAGPVGALSALALVGGAMGANSKMTPEQRKKFNETQNAHMQRIKDNSKW